MIEFNKPLYWVVSLLLFFGLLAGMYLYVTFFWLKVEPAIKARVEQRLAVKLNYSLFRFWSIDDTSWADYPGNRTTLWLTVTVINFAVVLGLVLVLVVAIAVLWLVLARLFRAP